MTPPNIPTPERKCPHCQGSLARYEDPLAVKIIGRIERENVVLREWLQKEIGESRIELFEGKPHYVHSATCPNYCDYACNGESGFKIAEALTQPTTI